MVLDSGYISNVTRDNGDGVLVVGGGGDGS